MIASKFQQVYNEKCQILSINEEILYGAGAYDK